MTENQSTKNTVNVTQKDNTKNVFGVKKNGTGQTQTQQTGLQSPVPTKTFDLDLKSPQQGSAAPTSKAKSTTKCSQSVGKKPSEVRRALAGQQGNNRSPNPTDKRKQLDDEEFLLISSIMFTQPSQGLARRRLKRINQVNLQSQALKLDLKQSSLQFPRLLLRRKELL